MSPPNQLYTDFSQSLDIKFGIHDKFFATLPSASDFHALIEQQGGLDQFIRLDITDVLQQMREHPQAELVIRVPTLGFTDPAFDYDIRPWFATPFSLNGFGSTSEAPFASRPHQILAKDLLGHEYPLLINEKGMLDYQQIASILGSAKVYTTLDAISFVYTKAQLVDGADLDKLPFHQLQQGAIWFRPPVVGAEAFSIEMELKEGDELLYSSELKVVPQSEGDFVHVNQLDLSYESMDQGGKIALNFDGQVTPRFAPEQYTIITEIPKLGDVKLFLASPFQQLSESASGTHWVVTDYNGLSQSALKQLVEILIPEQGLKQMFQTDTHLSGFNDFSSPVAFTALYQKVIQSVINTSLPLMALEGILNNAEDFIEKIEYLKEHTLNKADQLVLSKLFIFDESSNAEHPGYLIADRLDQLLSLDSHYPHSEISLFTSEPLNAEDLSVHVSFVAIDSHANEPAVSFNASIKGFEKSEFTEHVSDYFGGHEIPLSDEALAHAGVVGHRYTLSQYDPLHGPEIIQNFNWEQHDKLDLHPLLEQFASTSSPEISLKASQEGTEVWLQGSDAPDSAPIHVATLSGVPIDAIESNLHHYIEFPGS